jgi:hypothetical protein
LFFRESDVQLGNIPVEFPLNAVGKFNTPGVYYRPASLKNMTCILGNTEHRVIYNNFALKNLNSNAMDYSHSLYLKYLEYNYFLPAGDSRHYFSHMKQSTIPTAPSLESEKGLFNVFPLSLLSDDLVKHSNRSSTLGISVCIF